MIENEKSEFSAIAKGWSIDANEYDMGIKRQLSNHKDVFFWRQELGALLGKEPCNVLDVGCGPGFFTIMLSRLGHKVTSMDGSQGMVDCATQNLSADGGAANIYLGDAVTLIDEKAESFDAILSRDVVWTIYDPLKAFQRWRDLLRPGGRIIIFDGDYRRNQTSIRYHILKTTSNIIKRIADGKAAKTPVHGTNGSGFDTLPMPLHKRPEYDAELLRQAGFSRVEISNDRYRNSPFRLEYWKHGYQGKKFRVIAYK